LKDFAGIKDLLLIDFHGVEMQINRVLQFEYVALMERASLHTETLIKFTRKLKESFRGAKNLSHELLDEILVNF